jgi:hypothetical protein
MVVLRAAPRRRADYSGIGERAGGALSEQLEVLTNTGLVERVPRDLDLARHEHGDPLAVAPLERHAAVDIDYFELDGPPREQRL